MLLPGIVAATLMLAACAVVSVDTAVGKSALYAYYMWQRHRRARNPTRSKRLAAATTTSLFAGATASAWPRSSRRDGCRRPR